jgi:hypothetical protein
LFDRRINERNRARMPRFGAFFYSLYKPCGPFFRLFRRQFFHFRFRLPAFGLFFYLAAGFRLSPDDFRVEEEAYLIFRKHWPVNVAFFLISGLEHGATKSAVVEAAEKRICKRKRV